MKLTYQNSKHCSLVTDELEYYNIMIILVELRGHEWKNNYKFRVRCNLPRYYMTLLSDRPHSLSRKRENGGLKYGKLAANSRSQVSVVPSTHKPFVTKKKNYNYYIKNQCNVYINIIKTLYYVICFHHTYTRSIIY